jgi:putative ATPase
MNQPNKPLAELLRPATLEEVIGQEALCGPDGVLQEWIKADKPLSLILWGPPGSGKTTIARILAKAWDPMWESLSAITASAADLKRRFEVLRQQKSFKPLVLFMDEVHHFNRSQQDIFLPYLEERTIVLIGATTQNPSFSLNPAFLSRVSVFALAGLDEAAMGQLLARSLERLGGWLSVTPESAAQLIHWAGGDGRVLISMLEALVASITRAHDQEAGTPVELTLEQLSKIIQQRPLGFDRTGDDHYNLMSTLHKAVRASDVDGALYWLARMFQVGEDRAYILRRLVRMASEDIGLADPQGLLQAIAAWQAFERLGVPEGDLAIVQAVVYLASAPKSNAIYTAQKTASVLAKQTAHAPAPMHSLNAPTSMMSEMGYGKGYIYDHDTPEAFSGQSYFPPKVPRQTLYSPVERGFEREIAKRLAYWKGLREKK